VRRGCDRRAVAEGFEDRDDNALVEMAAGAPAPNRHAAGARRRPSLVAIVRGLQEARMHVGEAS
jgi:hypothetical protein